MDQVDPIRERRRDLFDQALERPFRQRAVLPERLVGDMAEIGFGLLHHRHVEEHAGLPELVVGAEPADAAGRGGNDRRGFALPHALPIGTRADVDGIFEPAGDRAVIFGGDEQHPVGGGDLFAEADPFGRRAGLHILVEQRQIADLDDGAVEFVAGDAAHRLGDLTVDAVLAQRTDDDRDFVIGHAG